MTKHTALKLFGGLTLTAASLGIVACGGSSSSAPVQQTTTAPPVWNNSSAWTGLKANSQSTLVLSASNLNATNPFAVKSKTVGGTVTLNGPNLQYTPSAGDVRPPAGYATPLTIVLTASGPGGNTDLTINPSVDPTAPQFTSTAPVGSFIPGSTYVYNLNASAPDGNKVTYSVVSATFGSTAIVAGSGAPGSGTYALTSPATAGNNAGVFQFSPSGAMANGVVNIVLSVSDVNTPTNVIAKQTFTINIGARAPIFLTTPSVTNITPNHPYGYVNNGPAQPYVFQVRNLDSNNTTVGVSGLPSGLSYTPGPTTTDSAGKIFSGTIGGTLAGSVTPGGYPVVITATDTVSGSVTTQQFTLNVSQDQKPTQVGNLPLFGVQATQFHDPANLREKLIWQNAGGLVVAEQRFMRSTMNGTGTWTAQQNMAPDDANSAAGYASAFSNPYLPGVYTSTVATVFGPFGGNADTTNWLNTYLGVQGAGWRYRALAPDQEKDGVFYFIKPNSVNVDGSPFTVTGKTVPTAVASVFPANTETVTIRPMPFGGTFPGGITKGNSPWGDSRVASSEYPTIDSATGEITWNPNTSAQWAFTVVAQQMVNGAPTQNQYTEIQINVPVYKNCAPWIGTLTLTGGTTTVDNVIIGGGTSTGSTVLGLPALQEPIARSTSQSIATTADTNNEYYTPNPTQSIWRWGVLSPAFPTTNNIGDPDMTNAPNTGHQDAWEMRVSGFTGGMLSLSGVTDPNVPGVLPGQNVFNSVTRANSTDPSKPNDSLFFNPWLSNNASKFELAWGPDRMQYIVARFAGMAASQFSGYIQDEYGAYSNQIPIAAFNLIFGDIRLTNSRYRFVTDNSSPSYVARGDFADAGYNTLGRDFAFMYLPLVGTSASNEANIFANLFNGGNGASTISGVNPLVVQFAQSGQDSAPVANAFFAATPGSGAASNWITLPHGADSLWTGGQNFTVTGQGYQNSAVPTFIPYPANKINGNAGFKAGHLLTTISGTSTGSTTYRQLSNVAAPVADPASVSLFANTNGFVAQGANAYSDNELKAGVIPHNSPYLAQIRTAGPGAPGVTNSYGPAGNTILFPWFLSAENPVYANNWYYGQLHSEVDFSKVLPGRGISTAAIANNAQGVFSALLTSRIRFNFSWPTTVTTKTLGTGSGPNNFNGADIMQVAIPQQGANGRYFFTGNSKVIAGYNGTALYNTAGQEYYSMYGVEATLFGGATTTLVAGDGFSVLSSKTFPIHALTNSIFVPWQTGNGAAGFPNSVTFTAGTNYTDLPLTGLKGIVAGTAVFANTPPADPTLIMADTNTIGLAANTYGYTQPVKGFTNNPSYISTTAGDRAFVLWMRPDAIDGTGTAYATWGATYLDAGSPMILGGHTTAPAFSMGNGLTDTNTQLQFSTAILPGTNQAANTSYAPTTTSAFWQTPQFWNLRTQVGHPTRSRQVNQGLTGAIAAADVASLAAFVANGNPDAEPLATAIAYAVRDHGAKGDGLFGEQGIEPAAPVIASWDASNAVAASPATNPGLPGILLATSGNVGFYSPFLSDIPGFQHVMELKFNYLVGINTPSVAKVYRQPAQVGAQYPFGASALSTTVTDPTKNDPLWYPTKTNASPAAVDFTTPVLTPIRQVKLHDYNPNTTLASTRIARVYDLVNGNATTTGAASGMLNLGIGSVTTDNAGVNKDTNLTLTWKQGQGDQVLPSGYIVTLYQVNVTAGNMPRALATYYVGHVYGNPATVQQQITVPSINSLLGNPIGTALTAGVGAVQATQNGFYFTIRSYWGQQGGKRIDFDKTPWAVGIPSAWADYVTGVFIAQ